LGATAIRCQRGGGVLGQGTNQTKEWCRVGVKGGQGGFTRPGPRMVKKNEKKRGTGPRKGGGHVRRRGKGTAGPTDQLRTKEVQKEGHEKATKETA